MRRPPRRGPRCAPGRCRQDSPRAPRAPARRRSRNRRRRSERTQHSRAARGRRFVPWRTGMLTRRRLLKLGAGGLAASAVGALGRGSGRGGRAALAGRHRDLGPAGPHARQQRGGVLVRQPVDQRFADRRRRPGQRQRTARREVSRLAGRQDLPGDPAGREVPGRHADHRAGREVQLRAVPAPQVPGDGAGVSRDRRRPGLQGRQRAVGDRDHRRQPARRAVHPEPPVSVLLRADRDGGGAARARARGRSTSRGCRRRRTRGSRSARGRTASPTGAKRRASRSRRFTTTGAAPRRCRAWCSS